MALTKISTDGISDDAVTTDKLANAINTARDANTAKTTNATHSGEVTGATALTIADNVVDEANLKVSNSPTNGYFLSAQSGNTGGLTWAQVTTDLVGDTSPQLGGNLDTNSFEISLDDDHKVNFGDSSDLKVYHDGSHSRIDNDTGALFLRNNTGTYNGESIKIQALSGENSIVCNPNAAVELYYDNSKKFETTNLGAQVTGRLNVSGNFEQDDNVKANWGNSHDLQIYHDGTDSYIQNTTGALYISPKSGENGIQLVPDGTVRLYYNNNSVFQTSQYGGNFAKAGEAIVEIGSTDGNGAYLTLDGASNGDGSGGDHASIFHDSSGNLHIKTDSPASNVSIAFSTNGTQRTIIDESGHLKPNSNNTYDLGTTSNRWRNVYTNDLNLSNEGSSNDVDGTWGSYTIQEGAEDLFLVNKRNGKKYKFNLTEVS